MKGIDDRQFEQIMKEHGEPLIRLAYLMVKDWGAAEDIMQDVFIKYYLNQDQFQGKSTLKTYLYRITINCCYNYLRSWKNKKKNFTEQIRGLFTDSYNPEKEILSNNRNSTLLEEILKLPTKYREVILLFYYQEFKIVTIALILNCSEGTVKTRLSRARKLLKTKLSVVDGEDWANE
ncbi:sigma-70 family RNA polymerase sigma factor [Psychrobacillus sp. FSL K6-4046]|uniref:RNA polymerase sigma factor n=1 Tax=Psychrobacillus sp. FSL K6-4046 TaxID=2921550 RepID=UPI00315B0C81